MVLLLLGLGWGSLSAQELVKRSAVPPTVVEEFEARFSDAEYVIWLKEGEQYYGARFQQLGRNHEAIFTPQGDWIQTTQDIEYVEMPDDARSYCRSNYPDYQAKAVQKVSTRKYGILYEIKVLGGMKQVGMTFDMHGKLVDEKEEEVSEGIEGQGARDNGQDGGGVKGKVSKLFKKGE
jgi:hypothetical protein